MTETSGDMRMLVEQIAQALVDAPEQVQVTPVEDGEAIVLELRVAATDLGKVTGPLVTPLRTSVVPLIVSITAVVAPLVPVTATR